uniref:GPI mannosyltransferase 2 n=1 Tax=Xenopus tropicalis TaxID=8364 RepID=A0A803JIR5_XENTR
MYGGRCSPAWSPDSPISFCSLPHLSNIWAELQEVACNGKLRRTVKQETRLCSTSLSQTTLLMPSRRHEPHLQHYSFHHFCLVSAIDEKVSPELMQLAIEKSYRVRGPPVPAWCAASLPLAYSNIQSDYWGVGLLRYFQLRQLPNFLLALPVILLGTRAIWEYGCANVNLCLTLGLWEKRQKSSSGYYGPRIFVYVAHLTALMMFGVFCMHVQVITRFLFSSSPVLFWFCSLRLQQNEPWMWGSETGMSASNPAIRLLHSWTSLQRPTRSLLGYFLGYWVLGSALHVNFLPWT